MIHVRGNILHVTRGIICHQVNAKGVMGAGLALQIKQKWPVVFRDYNQQHRKKHLKTGEVIFTNIVQGDYKLQVASLCAQQDYGTGPNKVYTNYEAFEACLKKLQIWHVSCIQGKLPIYFPYKIGCGLAGGDWAVIRSMIGRYFPNAIIMEKV